MTVEFPRQLPNRNTMRQMADFISEADISRVEACIVWFRKVSEAYQALEENLNQFGLSSARFGILSMLLNGGEDGVAPSELADEGGVTRATVTGLLDGLEKDGLVERIKHPDDRRMLRVHLTEKGRQLVVATLPAHFGRMAALLGELNEQELQQLMGLMDKVGPGALPK